MLFWFISSRSDTRCTENERDCLTVFNFLMKTSMTNMNISPFAGLKPASVWAHFAALCRIPRQSKHEETVVAFLKNWADKQGLENLVDKGGNLIIRKAASPRRETLPGVVLQGHLDMVCQKNEGIEHDFTKDPIRPQVNGNIVTADNTTLGADDGIGIALALAALEDKTLQHGPLEALFTVDEEEGMGGANNLETGILQGKILLNLDSETWGEFCIGCAGGIDVKASRQHQTEQVSKDWKTLQIAISGLRGGHSGVNIHEGRGNAIKLLVRLLNAVAKQIPIRINNLVGGTARNALPREASAIIAVAPGNIEKLTSLTQAYQTIYHNELSGVDDGITINLNEASASSVMSLADQTVWLNSLNAAPHGVWRMSPTIAGAPETSNNIGVVDIQPNQGTCVFMARSTIDSACDALADEIISLFTLSGTAAEKENGYPGWEPHFDSPILATSMAVYEKVFGHKPTTHIFHAGVECGILKAKYPVLDALSFGPTVNNPHSPKESLEIDTVEKAWLLLKAILEAIA